MDATSTGFETPKLTPKQRSEWAVTRAKGKNRFLLRPGLSFALGATAAAIVDQVWRFGFSLDTFTSNDFIFEVGMTFYVVYAACCFKQMLRWQKYEYLFLANDGDEQTSPTTAVK